MRPISLFLLKGISFFAHPQFTFPIILILLFAPEKEWLNLTVVMLISVIFPFAIFLHLYRTGEISDWDITKRTQRYGIFAATLVGLAFSLVYLYFFSLPLLFNEFLKLSILAVVLVIINFRIKISIHVAMVTVMAFLLVQVYSVSSWVFTILFLVAFSRVTLKRHTIFQVLLGALIPALFYMI